MNSKTTVVNITASCHNQGDKGLVIFKISCSSTTIRQIVFVYTQGKHADKQTDGQVNTLHNTSDQLYVSSIECKLIMTRSN